MPNWGTMKISSKGARAAALASLVMASTPGIAQQALTDLVPRQDFTDERGVDITGPVYRHAEPILTIGNGGGRPLDLSLRLTSPGLVQNGLGCGLGADIGNTIYLGLSSHAYFGNTATGTGLYTAVMPHQSGRFSIYTSSGGQLPLIVVPENGSIAGSFDSTHTYFYYVGGDGSEATFSTLHTIQPGYGSILVVGNADFVRYPDGETWTYRYNDLTWNAGGQCQGLKVSRVRSIVSSRGYAIQFDYAADPTGTVTSVATVQNFVSVVRATAYNKSSVHCDETLLQSCAAVTALSSATAFAYDRPNSRVTITKANGETVEFTFGQVGSDAQTVTSVVRPGGVSRTMTYVAFTDPDGPIYRSLTTLTEAGRTWDYGFSPSSGGGLTIVSEPGGATTLYGMNTETPYIIYDPFYRETWVDYDGYHRLLRRRYPLGNEVTAAYDARGNLNLVRQIPTTGSGLPTLQASAVYPASCASSDRRTCNQPTSTTDRNGNTTDFTYDTAHGGVLTQTGPAVPTRQNDGSIASIRPQTRNEYAQRYAWISNGSGGYAQAATPIWVLVRARSCRTTAASGSSCAGGAADEVVIDYDYGPSSGPNTLLLRGKTVTSIDGGVTTVLRTCYGYDVNGNRISETRPNANLASCS